MSSSARTNNALMDLEELEEHELDKIREHYSKLAQKAREELRQGISDTGSPVLDREEPSDKGG